MDIEAIRKQVEQQVMQYFHLEPTVTDAPYAGMVTGVDVISPSGALSSQPRHDA